jgi:anti-anti-sigma factor
MDATQYAMTIDQKPKCVLKFESIGNPFSNIRQRIYLTELIDEGYRYFVFDLSQLQYISSEGINFLLNALTTIRNHGGEMVLTSVPDTVDKLLYMTRLRAVFTVLPDPETALNVASISEYDGSRDV